VSTTNPEARLYRKSPGVGAVPRFMGLTVMENGSGLFVQADLTRADGRAEGRAAIDMLGRAPPGVARSAPTRPSTAPTSSPNCAGCAWPLTSPGTSLGDRPTRHAPRPLRRLAEAPQEDRGAVRLGQDLRRQGAAATPRRQEGPEGFTVAVAPATWSGCCGAERPLKQPPTRQSRNAFPNRASSAVL